MPTPTTLTPWLRPSPDSPIQVRRDDLGRTCATVFDPDAAGWGWYAINERGESRGAPKDAKPATEHDAKSLADAALRELGYEVPPLPPHSSPLT